MRVLAWVPEVAAVVGGAWILGEVVGGLALRHLVLTGASIPAALRAASRDLVRRPLSTLATTLVTDAGLALAAVLGILGSAAAAVSLRMTVGVRRIGAGGCHGPPAAGRGVGGDAPRDRRPGGLPQHRVDVRVRSNGDDWQGRG